MKLLRTLASVLIAFVLLFSSTAIADQSSLFSPTTGTVSGLNLSNYYNSAINALATCNSGAIAPANALSSAPVAGQCWMDTSVSRYKLKIFDGVSWLTEAQFDPSTHVWMPVIGGGSASIASASTTDLGSISENYLTITGTTTIINFGNSIPSGQMKVLRFASSGLNITYNATSLILPSNQSLVTVAGDTAVAISLGSGNWLLIYNTPGATLSGNNPFTGVNTHAGLETFNGGALLNGVTNKITIAGGPMVPPGGRLTLTSLAPLMTTDVAGATTVYYTPSASNFIELYNGTNWDWWNFSEVSQTLSDTTKSPAAAAASNAYDVFAWNDAGTFRATRGPSWATGGGSNTARGTGAGSTALTRQNGIFVNQVAITNGPAAGKGLYVGSFITNASNAVDWVANPASAAGGGNARLGIWNMYNQINVTATSLDSATWAAVSNAWTVCDVGATGAGLNNRITIFTGISNSRIVATSELHWAVYQYGGLVSGGIGVDTTSVNSALYSAGSQSGNAEVRLGLWSRYSGWALLGQHYYQMIQYGAAGNFNSSDARGTLGAGISVDASM